MQRAAKAFADARDETLCAEHVLLALLDQGNIEVRTAMRQSGINPRLARCEAAAALGIPGNLSVLPMPALPAFGTCGRRPLPLSEISPEATRVLQYRLSAIDVDQFRRPWQVRAMLRMESRAVQRILNSFALGADQYFSVVP